MGAKWGAAMTKDDSLKLALDASYDDNDTQTYQRPWVGLTDEERSYYLQSASNLGWWKAAQMIENKLRRKNT